MSDVGNGTNKRPLDALDVKIITMLYQNGRCANTEIARRLDVAEATVRKRIDSLLDNKVIRISAWADPFKLGFQTYANIEILADPQHLEQAAEEIAKFPEIFFLGICTGAFDILAVGLFRSNEHVYRFLTQQLPKVPGVQRTSTSNIIRTVKRDFPAPSLEQSGAGADDGNERSRELPAISDAILARRWRRGRPTRGKARGRKL